MDFKKPDDSEVLEIIRKFCSGGFGSDEKDEEMLDYISRAYSEISDLVFWDKRNLTPEQILEESKKKSKPLLL